MLEYRVLGSLSVVRRGVKVDLNRPLERRLLAILLTNRRRTLLDDQIIDALWPDNVPGRPGQALRTSVSRLRGLLGAPGDVVRDAGGYRLMVEPGSVDADRFEALLASTATHDRLARLRQALDLWSADEAFADFRYDDFVQVEVQRLQSLRLQAHEELFSERLASGESHELIPDLQSLVRVHPYREPLYGLLMRALYRAGQQPEALHAFQVARAKLADDLGLEPSKALVDLEHQILVQDPRLDAAGPAMPNNLPSRLASIIGRDADIDQVCAHVRDRRLVTVTGPVGVGKSTAAIESARRIVSEGAMESWYFDLADATPDDRLAASIADQLARLLVRSSDRDEQAVDPARLIGAKTMLIVLDNCDHVVDGIAAVAAAILRECPNARILATSREQLGLPGELVYPVAPLLAADDEAPVPHQAVETNPALHLFVERARAASPGFQLSPADIPAAVRLCRSVDGLPLAIELAAARVNSLAIAEIERQVAEHHTIPGSLRGVASRHESLRTAIAWTYDLLDEQEQQHLQILARVSGPFTITDAAHLLNLDEPSAVEAISSLRDRSLVRSRGEISQSRQFAMLGTIREFARAQAAAAGQSDMHAMRHAWCFHSLATNANRHLFGGPQQLQWLKRCQQNTPDLLHAAETFIDNGQVGSAIDLIANVGTVWTRFGREAAAYPTIRRALDAAGEDIFDSTPRVHVIASWIRTGTAEQQSRDAAAHAERALQTSRRVGDRDSEAVATALLGLNEWIAGQAEEARDTLAAACTLAAAHEPGWSETFAVLVAGIVEHAVRPAGATPPLLERAAELATTRSDEISKAWASTFLGSALKDSGDYARARATFQTAYESGRRIADPEPAAVGSAGLALVSSLCDDVDAASVASAQALTLLQPLSARAQLNALSDLYLGYEDLDIATVHGAMTLVATRPPAQQPREFLHFLLTVARERALAHLPPARVREIERGLAALDDMALARST